MTCRALGCNVVLMSDMFPFCSMCLVVSPPPPRQCASPCAAAAMCSARATATRRTTTAPSTTPHSTRWAFFQLPAVNGWLAQPWCVCCRCSHGRRHARAAPARRTATLAAAPHPSSPLSPPCHHCCRPTWPRPTRRWWPQRWTSSKAGPAHVRAAGSAAGSRRRPVQPGPPPSAASRGGSE